MNITYLGHAGFLVECGEDAILMDPWFDPHGAHAAAWFQFPANDHIDLSALERANYLYISHWHRDHYDEWFLRNTSDDFKDRVTVIISDYKYKKLRDWIAACGFRNVRELSTHESLHTTGGTEIRILREDNPLFVDSAILVNHNGFTFLNANDCKMSIAEEEALTRQYGKIDLYSAQFSGATFHPTCYTYPHERLLEISNERRRTKFERVHASIMRLGATTYLPAAGPACFLSDDLFHLNLNPETVFSTSKDFKRFLDKHAWKGTYIELYPAEQLHYDDGRPVLTRYENKVKDIYSLDYLRAYATVRKQYVQETVAAYVLPTSDVHNKAKEYFHRLAAHHVPELAQLANVDLEIRIDGADGGTFHLNTATGDITSAATSTNQQRYIFTTSSFWMQALLENLISWEDFILSFRYTITRDPDIYNEAIIAFLYLETQKEREDYVTQHIRHAQLHRERCVRTIDGKEVEYDRFCPHNGEDLSCAQVRDGILTCPRHFWQFDLNKNGDGINNPASIHASDTA